MTPRPIRRLLPMILLACWALPVPALARTTLRNICRVRGQEEITLQGLGIVAGLDGTGDGGNFLPTVRSLAMMMQLLGTPLGEQGTSELKDAKNVALVIVTATIPAAGARRGDKIDCTLSAISAKSLAGGHLLLTPLTGPLPQQNPVVFALAEGPLTLDNETLLTTARIHGGCRLAEDFFNPFSENGQVTLVVDKDYAGFQVTQEIAEVINTRRELLGGGEQTLAKAIDQVNVEVTIPAAYRDHLVQFVSEILSLEMLELRTGSRVVIRERSGTIVIDGDVEIGPVLVTHKGVVVETGGASANEFVAVDSRSEENPKLKALLAALNAIRVPPEDKIEIIKALHRNGKLYAELIIE